MFNQIRRFFMSVPWISLIVGAALGAVIVLGIQDWLSRRASQGGVAWQWQLALGLVLGGIVSWVIPEFINALRQSWKTVRPLQRLLNPFHDNASAVTIFTASLYPTSIDIFEKSVPLELHKTVKVVPHHGIPWVLTESDAQALGYVMALLAQAGRTKNISIVRDDIGISLTDTNMICIGSPKSNHKTQQVNDSFKGLPLRFGWEQGRQIISRNDGNEVWRSDNFYDYGVLAKIPNEHDRVKSVIIIAGISYIGTAGIGYYLWKHWRKIEADTKGKPFAMVLKIRRDNFQYVEQELPLLFVESGP